LPVGECVSSAYVSSLWHTLNQEGLAQVTRVKQPIIESRVNIDQVFNSKYENFNFPDGRTGAWWLQDRLNALLRQEGEYWRPMRKHAQYDYVIKVLKGIRKGDIPRWNSNRLFMTLFDPSKDLHVERAPTPPCLVTLDWKPVRDQLSLVATFRSQYMDAKAYGNLLSLAYLLLEVSEKTGFKPAELYSVAHKPILKYPVKVVQSMLNLASLAGFSLSRIVSSSGGSGNE